jgi:hypothetical protein
MTLEYDFSGIRLQEGSLTPVDWKLTVDLVATGKKGKAREEVEYDASITYQKIYFWLDTNLPNIIAVDVNSEDDLYLANLATNIMMYCPGIPSDDLLTQLLHSKISILAGTDLLVGEIHLKGSDSTLHYTFDCSDGLYILPRTTAEYYPESATRDTIPWWMRNDGFCFEFARPEDNTQTDEELFGGITDPLEEFHRIMAEVSDSHIGLIKEPAKIIQVEKWKPRKVE